MKIHPVPLMVSALQPPQPHRAVRSPTGSRSGASAFTLIEMLVVIAIIALLASLIVPAISNALSRAKTLQGIAGIRQTGTFLITEASNREGRIKVHITGSSGDMGTYRIYNLVNEYVGAADKNSTAIGRIVRTPAWWTHPNGGNLSTWEVWGVNYEDNPDLGVYWRKEAVPGYPEEVHVLDFSTVSQPSSYAILADNADLQGVPRTRFTASVASGYTFALRYGEKGIIYCLDGSAKLIGEEQMEDYHIRMGYLFKKSNPATKPYRRVIAY